MLKMFRYFVIPVLFFMHSINSYFLSVAPRRSTSRSGCSGRGCSCSLWPAAAADSCCRPCRLGRSPGCQITAPAVLELGFAELQLCSSSHTQRWSPQSGGQRSPRSPRLTQTTLLPPSLLRSRLRRCSRSGLGVIRNKCFNLKRRSNRRNQNMLLSSSDFDWQGFENYEWDL